jgi:prepilin-type N-terminal cleavage/methylation domain-containing protein
MKATRHATTSLHAFTLVEMMVVMLVLTLLLGAIFGIVRGTVQLTDDLSVAQAREARVHGLAQLCERTLRALPAHTMVRLRTEQTGSRYLTQLVLAGSPPLLTHEGAPDDVTVWETEEAADGYLRLQMRCLTAVEAVAWDQGDTRVGTRLLLLENLASLEWRVFNPSSHQWEPLWNDRLALPQPRRTVPLTPATGADESAGADRDDDEGVETPEPSGAGDPEGLLQTGKRPSLMELSLTQGTDAPLKWIFWVPGAETPGAGF